MKTVTLLIGTSKAVLDSMKNGKYNALVFASNNLETVSHYWNGCTVAIRVKLVKQYKRKYAASIREITNYTPDKLMWGVCEPLYPENCNWYCFTAPYLRKYLEKVWEVYPDLSKYAEDD